MSVPTIVLASGSPRRLALVRRLGVEPIVRPADVDETPRPGEAPGDLVARLARAKADAVDADPDDLVVAADTVVALGARIMGKPADDRQAAEMLTDLSGRAHQVITGVAVRRGDQHHDAIETTRVHVRQLAASEVHWYVATGEPRDKAGAYALQGAGASLVEGIEGSDTNVIGLPLATLVALCRHVGVDLLSADGAA